jgi:hypothetical protein
MKAKQERDGSETEAGQNRDKSGMKPGQKRDRNETEAKRKRDRTGTKAGQKWKNSARSGIILKILISYKMEIFLLL